MIFSTQAAFLFPGQGAYQPGAFAVAARAHGSVIEDALREIDSVSRTHFNSSVRDLLLDPNAPALSTLLERDPDTMQLAIYAGAVATYRLLEKHLIRPPIL